MNQDLKNIANLYELYTLYQRKRRWWVRPLNVDRDSSGYFTRVFLPMKNGDPEEFFIQTRMLRPQYELLLLMMEPHLIKFSVRPSIHFECRLALTLSTQRDASHDLLGSQRVYKKSSPNSMLTIYIPTRELVSRNGIVAPLKGVLYADTKFIQGHRIFGQLTLTFRYGREDEEVMGLRFCNEAVMCLTQIWPPNENKTDEKDTLTPLQDALVKRLGEGAFPFTMEVTPQAPPSVQLVPAKRYYGAPIGTSYDIRCYVADRSDEKLHRRSTVRMGVRLIHKTNISNLQSDKAPENFTTIINNQTESSTSPPPTSSSTSVTTPTPSQSVRSSKNDRYDSFSKLKLSPKAFRFTGKLCRSKSEIEKSSNDFYEGITNDFESTRGPQGSVDKPFLLQEGKVCLRASLDKSVYAHGENVDVTVDIKNDSRKTVRRIRVTAIQHVDVCMFSNGKFKNVVAESDASLSDISVKPGSTLHTIYSLHPQRGPTKNWIALEDSLQRCNEPNAITALIASSALRSPATVNNPDERNVFAIYVSYYIKVKLTLSGMGGELSLKLPFTLAHTETNNSIRCDNDHVDHSPHNHQLRRNNNKCDQDNDSTSTKSNNVLANQSASSSTNPTTTTSTTTNVTQKSASQQAAASLTSSFRNCNISFSNKSKFVPQQQQSIQDHDTEALDKIDQITTEDITVDQEQNNIKRKSLVMLKHTRQNTLQISSIDDDKDDDDDDNCIVGTTANDLLNSPDYDMRKNTETTCVEVHASSS